MQLRKGDFLYKLVKYNLKIIFAGKFVWFLIAALAVFILFMFQSAWDPTVLNEGVVYTIMLFPSILLIFYPTVFGIQNDEDARILELIFGIPNYRYKVWGFRLLMIYVAVFFILIAFSYLAYWLLCPVESLQIACHLLFPVLFFGNLAFLFSTMTRSGNGTAVLLIICCLSPLFFKSLLNGTMWDVYLNPFEKPDAVHALIWESTVMKNRFFLLIGSIFFMLAGLLNLQNREKFM
ncbi:MAG: hypothetical protein LBR67_07680 [Dysgonamonadaceae bacterium]|jgi:hypothetical protein|nr:hypothetical protein [Dysgonamonadaceae bacterium]